ncbi:glycerophosphodiester phosphodiesterase family protein [Niabella beijingensis]|uniref:glycerophosphodiester phosphodiesterase family protein n=1 Tax=Niabella beijingensis TaxID=2872700 RepID=UPI001CBC92A1|nr:glycerophosphodiester phosphodiesterase family protein [Niabella beijingensis]MBZ4191371.1 glycerophosphodiester phosphodiesterase family protein [Niabella beijingensis]
MKQYFITGCLIGIAAIGNLSAQSPALRVYKMNTLKQAQSFFHYKGKNKQIISGHRGGITKGFPENSIETFENTLKYTEAFYEVDPRMTKDSVVVLLHDATLDRVTTGKGNISDHTFAELQQLRLKDRDGNVTAARIPTLMDAIKWSKGKTILNLDNKGVAFETIAKIIRESGNPLVMLTIHSPEQARFYLDQNPESIFSVHILSKKSFDAYEAAGIPWKNMIAYIGPKFTPENRELLKLLHGKGVMCMISAAPTTDKLTDEAERAGGYRAIFSEGADILESDLPIEVAAAIKKK